MCRGIDTMFPRGKDYANVIRIKELIDKYFQTP